ncbi:MAG: hypothetical protein IT209_05380 [Armatimonadetes bacterium]|nr:hypothetical protein [Armatimonadota bacterium]
MRFALGMWVMAALALSGCARQASVRSAAPPAHQSRSNPETHLSADYVHPPSGLRLKAPQGWGFVDKPEVDYVQAQCQPTKATGDLPVMLLQASKISTDLSMEALVAGYSKQMARGVDSPDIEKDEQIKGGTGGAEGYEIVFTGKLKHKAVKGRQVILRRDGWFYVITQMAPQADYPRYSAAFETLTNSVAFK